MAVDWVTCQRMADKVWAGMVIRWLAKNQGWDSGGSQCETLGQEVFAWCNSIKSTFLPDSESGFTNGEDAS